MPLMVTLQSSDLEKFVIEKDVAKKSILVKNLLEDLPEDDEPIPIPLVNSAILKKVLTWMQQHKVYLLREDIQTKKKLSIRALPESGGGKGEFTLARIFWTPFLDAHCQKQ